EEPTRPVRGNAVRLLEREQIAVEELVREVRWARPPALPRRGAVSPAEEVADDPLFGEADVDRRLRRRPVALRPSDLQPAQDGVDDDVARERAEHAHREG